MGEMIGRKELVAMLNGAVDLIRENQDLLTTLDSAIGDGDHGTTMVRAMQALEISMQKSLHIGGDKENKDLLYDIGWAIMSADGGSTGPLLGSLFMGMSEGVATEEMDCPALATMISAGVTKMHKQSRAQIGDKTMMDALLPAQQAINEVDPATTPREGLALAAAAATRGAEATKEMRAKFGRARNLGDRVLGHGDPGAFSIALIFQGFVRGLADS